MPIDTNLYSTSVLLGVMRELEPPSSYWLDLCFPQTITFTEEYIDFEKIVSQRKLAPLVVPMAQGKPIYSAGSKVYRVKPAYVKPKDAVSLTRVIKQKAGNIAGNRPQTPEDRYNAVVGDIMREHREAIERRWEWMASQAVQFGEVTLEDDAYPLAVVDFERDANHSITLGMGERWGDMDVSIMGNIEEWRTMMRRAKFAGSPNRMTVGVDVWEVMRQDEELRELLKVDFRPSNNGLALNLGVREGLDVEFVGRLSGTLDIYVYNDYYQDADGEVVPFMDPRDVVLTGPNVRGVRCYGAILDKGANFRPLPIFPKMWDENDPPVTFIMNQSAPLMVPVNPNATLRARVLA